MSLSVDGVWKVGVWAQTVWADGVWREGAYSNIDYHDGDDRKHSDREKKKWEEFKQAKIDLRNQITEALEVITGEARVPDEKELIALEKQAGQQPKKARPEYRRVMRQVRNWDEELRIIEQHMAQMEEDDIQAILLLL